MGTCCTTFDLCFLWLQLVGIYQYAKNIPRDLNGMAVFTIFGVWSRLVSKKTGID